MDNEEEVNNEHLWTMKKNQKNTASQQLYNEKCKLSILYLTLYNNPQPWTNFNIVIKCWQKKYANFNQDTHNISSLKIPLQKYCVLGHWIHPWVNLDDKPSRHISWNIIHRIQILFVLNLTIIITSPSLMEFKMSPYPPPHSFESVGALRCCVRVRQKWRHLETSITRLARQPQTWIGRVSHSTSEGSERHGGGGALRTEAHRVCPFVNWSLISLNAT